MYTVFYIEYIFHYLAHQIHNIMSLTKGHQREMAKLGLDPANKEHIKRYRADLREQQRLVEANFERTKELKKLATINWLQQATAQQLIRAMSTALNRTEVTGISEPAWFTVQHEGMEISTYIHLTELLPCILAKLEHVELAKFCSEL